MLLLVVGEMCKGCRGDVQRLPGRCAKVAGEMCKGCRGDVPRLLGRCASVGKQSQLLLQPTEVELGLQVGVEFDKESICKKLKTQILICDSVF